MTASAQIFLSRSYIFDKTTLFTAIANFSQWEKPDSKTQEIHKKRRKTVITNGYTKVLFIIYFLFI
ncbi:hypothetical protein D7322_15695 [Sphingobacterium puteale]|uniref:Uncharacterized protein n=1 Tax=Sphingobacterium puteale TaxID=2420510 RepID=A0A420VWM1_9SPHI|nr:hypothetical protein D7322_15695 [Sphingobacterium puteale]